MKLWHLTQDAPRHPLRVSQGDEVVLTVGTWPIQPNQSVYLIYVIIRPDGTTITGEKELLWEYNQGGNSYWMVNLGTFDDSYKVTYTLYGHSTEDKTVGSTYNFQVGPKIYLTILWHQHQPVYKDNSSQSNKGSYRFPWVRLHSLRDYYSMASIIMEHPEFHCNFNMTSSLLWQLRDYYENGATDRALELTLKPAEELLKKEVDEILSTFFEANWHNQIIPYHRYKELFLKRKEGESFNFQEIRDLQMWFNLCWFGKEFRDGEVVLVTGDSVDVSEYVLKGQNFTVRDINNVVDQQYRIMRAIIPLHKELQDSGQIEVSTTPFFHPILPLLIDTDGAVIDRTGAKLPNRFSRPEDAEFQVSSAIEYYIECFGKAPKGMWPAEGAVSQNSIPFYVKNGIKWIATDKGVLSKSGRFGYDAADPNILCQPYRAEQDDSAIIVFFRDTGLSDAIGFRYHDYSEPSLAAEEFISEIKSGIVSRISGSDDRILSVILDGENAWGAYKDDGRPFLHELYKKLENDPEIRTVTFSEYLVGNEKRGISSHTMLDQIKVYDLYSGSWIDEMGSAQGVDLGTWIGEEEENKAWELLGETRDFLDRYGTNTENDKLAFQSMYMAEASDWFWWLGSDHSSGSDQEFDDLFRKHLKNVYYLLGYDLPHNLNDHIVPHTIVWRHAKPVQKIQSHDLLTILTNCPGILKWKLTGSSYVSEPLKPVGGVMAGIQRYSINLGPFTDLKGQLYFVFECTYPGCDKTDICCDRKEYYVNIENK